MKSTVELLSVKERTALALWYDTESYKALKHLLQEERLNICTKLLDVAPDDTAVIGRHQGRADGLKQLHLVLKQNYEKYIKASDGDKKKQTS